MHGLIFVTWEKFLSEQFGSSFLVRYRSTIGETMATSPLTSRVYDDATLLGGVGAACQLSGLSADLLLRAFGNYFILNGLTSHLCAYLLTSVYSGYDLLLAMRDAHEQMRRTSEALTPPLFRYEVHSSNPGALVLIYDSPRRLCPVLWGAIEGAAKRYGEKVKVVERTCMKQGARVCRFEVQFFASPETQVEHQVTPEQQARRVAQQQLALLVLAVLPDSDGVTLMELQRTLQKRQGDPRQWRPSVLLEALRHLQHVGLANTTANQPGDNLTHRRYWRAPTTQ
jgi:Haem-NO-binding